MKDSFSDLTYEELVIKRKELKNQYRDVCYRAVTGHVDNPLEKRTLRAKIARLNTVVHEFDIGIRRRQ